MKNPIEALKKIKQIAYDIEVGEMAERALEGKWLCVEIPEPDENDGCNKDCPILSSCPHSIYINKSGQLWSKKPYVIGPGCPWYEKP